MSCDGCGRNGIQLFDVIESSWKEYTRSRQLSALQRRSIVCGECLVGKKSVPVRRSVGKWQMGEIVSFNCETQEHRVLFEVDDQETLSVSSKPFLDYTATCNSEPFVKMECSAMLIGSQPDEEAPILSPSRSGYNFSNDDVPTNTTSSSEPSGVSTSPPSPKDDVILNSDGQFVFHTDGTSLVGLGDDNSSVDTMDKISYQNLPELPQSPIHGHGLSWISQAWNEPDQMPSLELELSVHETTPNKRSSTEALGISSSEEQAGSPKKMCPRLWTAEEDQLLLDSIDASDDKDLKWPTIAQSVPGRTGKQCRERYLNHLQPKLFRVQKTTWSPTEDALICHMNNNAIGWSVTAKLLEGRSDNAVKNRYHHIRRKLEKLLMHAPKSPTSNASHDKADESAANTSNVNEKVALLGTAVDIILKARQNPKAEASSSSKWHYEYDFSFDTVDSDKSSAEAICQRCALLVPSPQTGRSICRKTGWCESCASAPPYLSENFLRKLHMANGGTDTDIAESTTVP